MSPHFFSAMSVVLLWAAGLGAAGQFAKIALILPELAAVYPDRGATLGWLVSLVSLVGLMLGLSAGLIAVRIGLKRLLVLALALGAAVSLVQATLPDFTVMLASRVVEGAAHLGVVVAAPTLIAGLVGERWRGFAMTLWGTFFGVAFALVAWLGLPLVRTAGPDALFLAHALYMAAAALLVAPCVPAMEGGGRPASFGGVRAIARRHLAVYASPFTAAPAAGWLFYTLSFVALATVLPGTVAPDERAFLAGTMPVASIVSSMTLGVWLLRRTTAVNVVMLGFAAAAVLALALAFAPGGTVLPVALFAALGLVQGATFAVVPELNGAADARAAANGGLAQTGNLGNALGTPALLALAAGAGLGPALAVVAFVLATGLLVHALLARARRTVAAATSRAT